MKELSFCRCYVNGNKCCIMSYDNGAAILGCFGTWAKNLPAYCYDDFRGWWESGEISSMRGVQGALRLPSADVAGIQSVLPGAVVNLPGSPEYEARVSAAVGSRGGSSKPAAAASSSSAPKASTPEASSAPASAPAVVASDAFRVPSISGCQELENITRIIPGLVSPLNEWAAAIASAVLSGGAAPDMPEDVAKLAPVVPGLEDAAKAYAAVVSAAAEDHRARLEADRLAAEKAAAAAAAARAAAESGKTLLTLPGADGATVEVTGKPHKETAKVVRLLQRGRNVYLCGPAGTGKTYLCKQAAEALGLKFYSDQKISDEYQLTGFVDGPGKFQETELYRAATRGGVYMLDEFDASNECAAIVLNSLLANRYMTFPGIGRVDAHPDFRVIACGNTIGRGADSDYTGRNCLDAATLDRFVSVAVDYDPEIEMRVSGGDQDLVEFIHAVRAAVKSCGAPLLVSMRAIDNIASVSDCFEPEDCLQMCLLKGLEKDQISLIAGAVTGSGKWFDALKNLAA